MCLSCHGILFYKHGWSRKSYIVSKIQNPTVTMMICFGSQMNNLNSIFIVKWETLCQFVVEMEKNSYLTDALGTLHLSVAIAPNIQHTGCYGKPISYHGTKYFTEILQIQYIEEWVMTKRLPWQNECKITWLLCRFRSLNSWYPWIPLNALQSLRVGMLLWGKTLHQ